MAAFNIIGVARVELASPKTDLAALTIEAVAIFNAINAARHRAGAGDLQDGTICQGHRVLVRLYWHPTMGARVKHDDRGEQGIGIGGMKGDD
jgi:hypothetical protein